jgi:three-Cys-motif partner protein
LAKDIHIKPFDEGTKAKLAIFQDYLREWLPVFTKRKEVFWKTINIYDFFAGPGADLLGVKGTPLLIIDELENHLEAINEKKLNVNLYFNEYSESKCNELKQKLKYLALTNKPYNIEVESLDFKVAFNKNGTKMAKNGVTNLVFLDQNGIKHISEDVFKYLINIKRTDFLFFISSSTIKRFCDHPNIIQHINLSIEEVEKKPYHQIHRLVLDYYRSLIPTNKELYLAPFSLKKGPNVYGLIFGSSHVLGIEKFLTTCWKIDPDRGEANFDIDNDNIREGQLDIFSGELDKPKKTEVFENELAKQILDSSLKTDKDIYLFAITSGFLPSHAKAVIKSLVYKNKINNTFLNLSSKICRFDASPSTVSLK